MAKAKHPAPKLRDWAFEMGWIYEGRDRGLSLFRCMGCEAFCWVKDADIHSECEACYWTAKSQAAHDGALGHGNSMWRPRAKA